MRGILATPEGTDYRVIVQCRRRRAFTVRISYTLSVFSLAKLYVYRAGQLVYLKLVYLSSDILFGGHASSMLSFAINF